jgi:hypothetical protein
MIIRYAAQKANKQSFRSDKWSSVVGQTHISAHQRTSADIRAHQKTIRGQTVYIRSTSEARLRTSKNG